MSKDNKRMSDKQLVQHSDSLVRNSIYNDTGFLNMNDKLNEQFHNVPYGDEQANKSQAQSRDIYDGVQSDMTSLTRIFQSPENNFKFNPLTTAIRDVDEAKEKSIYVNHIIDSQQDSFKLINDGMKAGLINTLSVLKTFVEKIEIVKEETYENVTKSALGLLEEEIEEEIGKDKVKSIEILTVTESKLDIPQEDFENIRALINQQKQQLPQEEITETTDEEVVDAYESLKEVGKVEDREATFEVTVKIITKEKRQKIVPVPLENFILSADAMNKDDADVVGDIIRKTRGQLIAEGYPRDMVEQLPTYGESNNDIEQAKRQRLAGINVSYKNDTTTSNPDSEEVELRDLYMMVDYDGDGIMERRHVLISGDKVLENEIFDHVPYSLFSSITNPFTAIGGSRAKELQDYQRLNTVLLRGVMDNTTMTNNIGFLVNKNVNLDDLSVSRPNRIVRTKGDGQVGFDLQPLVTEYTADRTLGVLQHMDNRKANTSGNMISNQGLTKDSMSQETATRFEGIQQNGAAKLEMVARIYAETGFKQLAETIVWLAKNFIDSEESIVVDEDDLVINPSKWTTEHKASVSYNDKQKNIETMNGALAILTQLKTMGSTIVDDKKIFNVVQELLKGAGISNTKDYINDPEKPEQMLLAENEQLKAANAELQQFAGNNQLAEAATIEAQGKLQEQQHKQQVDLLKLELENKKADQEQALKLKELEIKEQQLALDITKVELEANRQLDAEIKSNQNI